VSDREVSVEAIAGCKTLLHPPCDDNFIADIMMDCTLRGYDRLRQITKTFIQEPVVLQVSEALR
jgi:hypothetical protein